MLFNSFEFLIFFPIVVGIYYFLPHRIGWIFLLIASYYFYMCWKVEYVFLIFASTLSAYTAALLMFKENQKKKKKIYLFASVGFNLILLLVFKYFNFLNDSVRSAFNFFNIFYNVPAFKLLLPVGISFYTFQTIGYLVDVYREEVKAEKHLGIFALYVAFFPKLVAGPIERAKSFLPQCLENHPFDSQGVRDGLTLMLWGCFKKVVIADRLAITVNSTFSTPAEYSSIQLLIAAYFYTIQIYCDFSGYTDIAIGAAQVMGYRLMENFRRPYFAQSISEFWKRWHISLSTWFRDYLYIPLGGSRVKTLRHYVNLLIVFLLCGAWHGANWTFIVWGGLHGLYLVCALMTKDVRGKILGFLKLHRFPAVHTAIKVFITFNLVTFAWIFFRAESLSAAQSFVKSLFLNFSYRGPLIVGLNHYESFIALGAIIITVVAEVFQENKMLQDMRTRCPRWLRWMVYYALIISIGLFGDYSQQAFIYFQF